VADGKLYNLSGTGNLICIDAKTGSTVWGLNILDEFDGRMVTWGMSESPLVDGDNVMCFPGGEEIGMVALDKDTGQTRWTCVEIGDKPSYATATIIDCQGLRQILTMTSESAVGVAAETGKLLWKYPHKVRFEANCDTPLYHDGHVYLFGTYGYGATKLKLNVAGDSCSVEKIWHTSELDNEHGGVMITDGYLYGQADANHKQRHMACLEATTGKTMWTARELAGRASATLTFAEGMFYIVSDQGVVALVKPNPKRLEIVSKFELPEDGESEVRARPVVCGGRLYIRHDQILYVYDVRAK
jgi:outer membrane protein assembly factor BamB